MIYASRMGLDERVLLEVERARDEIVDFASGLIRIPTVNPPGEGYRECARFLGERLARFGCHVEYPEAADHPDHSERYPRLNVVGILRGSEPRPLVHLNGHVDVVPPGDGWSVDPFGGLVREGKIYGRGASDMKAGIAAAVYAVEAIRRAGVSLRGTVEVSGTVDEESGGFAGVAFICERGWISKSRTDHVIIPEPLGVDRICLGHRGVHWFKVTAHGRIAHGSMPFLGESAIDRMGVLLDAVRRELKPALARRTTKTPVVPEGARHATLNVNSIVGGQAGVERESPCVADRCEAVFDRRFLIEEGFEAAKAEIEALVAGVAREVGDAHAFDLKDLMVVHPVETPQDAGVVDALDSAIRRVLGREPARIASPGTYDHKHVARIGGVESCVAYGPGILELAHQVDEYCLVEDLMASTKVIALATLGLAGEKE
jgi:succinyl-diaminopimelate desuccinylase